MPTNWEWDWTAIEADFTRHNQSKAEDLWTDARAIQVLDAQHNVKLTPALPPDQQLLALARCFPTAKARLSQGIERLGRLRSLASVLQLHLLMFQQSVGPKDHEHQSISALQSIRAESTHWLQQVAGDWGRIDLTEKTLVTEARERLEQTSRLLYRALQSDDLEPFVQVMEQVFESSEVVVPVSWIHPPKQQANEQKEEEPEDPFLSSLGTAELPWYLPSLLQAAEHAQIPQLSDLEQFQDAKDIQRDELVICGQHFAGSKGYEQMLEALQTAIDTLESEDATGGMDGFAEHHEQMAKHILHATNRTESGGSSYEILSLLVSNHSQERVLLRPDSTRAKPLQVRMSIGPFVSMPHALNHPQSASDEPCWFYGLRVLIEAETSYLICDSHDPTKELFIIEATYRNRLAYSRNMHVKGFHVRHDVGHVKFRVVPQEHVSEWDDWEEGLTDQMQ